MANELTEFEKKILELLKDQGPLNVKDIAQTLNLNCESVNFALLGNLNAYCKQDNNYNWYLDLNVTYPLTSKIITEKKDYIEILKGHSIDELATYLAETSDIMKKPHDLFIIPMIKTTIMDSSQIKLIIQAIHDNNVDLNSNAYYLNRTDALKGVDLVGGILFYLLSFAVQKQKRTLTTQEVDVILNIINEAVSLGWRKDNPLANNRTIKDLVYMYMSKKHPELKPIYSLLVAESTVQKANIQNDEDVLSVELENNDIVEDTEEKSIINEPSNIVPETKKLIDEELREEHAKPLKRDAGTFIIVKNFLNGISINGYIDPGYLSSKIQIGQNLIEKLSLCGCHTLEELVEECGLQVGPIQGNVEYEAIADTIVLSDDVEKLLNQKIKDFSNRSFNRLTMYGVKTNKDLLDLDLTKFAKFRGVGVSIVDEVSSRIKELRETFLKLSANDETSDKVEENKNNSIQPERILQDSDIQKESFDVSTVQEDKKVDVDNAEIDNSKISQKSQYLFSVIRDVIEEIKTIYNDKEPAESVNEIFEQYPQYKKFYGALILNSKRVFGMSLYKYLKQIGVVKSDQYIAKPVFKELEKEDEEKNIDNVQENKTIIVTDVLETSDKLDNHPNNDNNQSDKTQKILVEVTKTEENTVNEVEKENESYIEIELDVEEKRSLKMLSTVFKNKTVNLQRLKGTTLLRSLEVSAKKRQISIEKYIANNGYTLSESTKENFKIKFNRLYR